VLQVNTLTDGVVEPSIFTIVNVTGRGCLQAPTLSGRWVGWNLCSAGLLLSLVRVLEAISQRFPRCAEPEINDECLTRVPGFSVVSNSLSPAPAAAGVFRPFAGLARFLRVQGS
jgi:hypothetical protein